MQVILGVIFHFIGGFASGSFYMPYKKVKGWAWESYWIIGGLFSWLIVPPLAAYLTIPDFAEIITPDRWINSLIYIYIRFAMGDRRVNIWPWSTLPGRFIWKQHHTWTLHGIRCIDTICIL